VRSRREPAQKETSLLVKPVAPLPAGAAHIAFNTRPTTRASRPTTAVAALLFTCMDFQRTGRYRDKWAVLCRIGENRVTWGSKGQYGAVRRKWAQYSAAAQRNSLQFSSDNDAERHPANKERPAILQRITCTRNKR